MKTLMTQRINEQKFPVNGPADDERIYQTDVQLPLPKKTDYIFDMKRRMKRFSGYAVNDYSDSFYLAFMRMPLA